MSCQRASLALGHALQRGQPVWVDHAESPRCLVMERLAQSEREVFATGELGRAVLAWLSTMRGPLVLAAPPGWMQPLSNAFKASEARRLLVFEAPEGSRPWLEPSTQRRVKVRRPARTGEALAWDVQAFEHLVPTWGWRSWQSPMACLVEGQAVLVPYRHQLVSAAWVVEDDGQRAALGVFTDPRYRQLGLATAAVSALLRDRRLRHREPFWFTGPDNAVSAHLATRLGLTRKRSEGLLAW